jgi:hypothetical protein
VTRIGIFGWGVVAPKSPNIDVFEQNLSKTTTWLTPFQGFGPSNFLVGHPEFDFSVYKPWLDEHFGPRKYSQLDEKMGNMIKYAIGAFIQSLQQNPGIDRLLQELETAAHVYVGTGLGDFPLQYDRVLIYYKAQKRWNRFWCQDKYHPELSAYRKASPDGKRRLREGVNAPPDPESLNQWDDGYEDTDAAWYAFWVQRSEGLKRYLRRHREGQDAPDSPKVGRQAQAQRQVRLPGGTLERGRPDPALEHPQHTGGPDIHDR